MLLFSGFCCISDLSESVDLKKGFLVRLTTGQYINIALTTGQYGIYCPVGGFDLPTQWATNVRIQLTNPSPQSSVSETNDHVISSLPPTIQIYDLHLIVGQLEWP